MTSLPGSANTSSHVVPVVDPDSGTTTNTKKKKSDDRVDVKSQKVGVHPCAALKDIVHRENRVLHKVHRYLKRISLVLAISNGVGPVIMSTLLQLSHVFFPGHGAQAAISGMMISLHLMVNSAQHILKIDQKTQEVESKMKICDKLESNLQIALTKPIEDLQEGLLLEIEKEFEESLRIGQFVVPEWAYDAYDAVKA